MKKLAVICNYKLNPLRIGGMDRFFVAYDKACKEKGFEVKWFFSGGEIFNFYEGLDIQFTRETSVESCLFNFQQEKGIKYDFIVTHFVELCTSFFKKIKQDGKPYIISVDHNPRPLNGLPFKKRIRNRLKGKLYSRHIDRFIGVSNYTREQILKDYGKNLNFKTKVIYNGIECKEYKLRHEVNHGRFIVASHLRPSKGIQDLVLAVSLLDTELKQMLRIDIFGEGPMEMQLKSLVTKKNLQDQIRFCGSSPCLPELYQNYSYLLQPTYMECFSLSILESLAANVPIITTTVGGNTEVVEDGVNGFLFQPGNINELSKILENVILQKKMINKPVNPLIENKYYLQKMVDDHVELLGNSSD